jgi:hypothetical protein
MEGLACVEDDLFFSQALGALQQQGSIESWAARVEKFLQQRQRVGVASRLQKNPREKVRG